MSVETGWQEAGSFKRNKRDLLDYQKFLRALAKDLGIRVMDFTKALPPEENGIPTVFIPIKKAMKRWPFWR